MKPQRNKKKPYKIAHEATQSFNKINAYHICFFIINWYRIILCEFLRIFFCIFTLFLFWFHIDFQLVSSMLTCLFFQVLSPEKNAYYIICYALENVPSDYMLHTNVMQSTQKVPLSNEHQLSILFVFWI